MRHRNFMRRGYVPLIAVLCLLLFAGRAQASLVAVSPGSLSATTGDTITLSIRIDQVAGLGGFQFGFSFDPSLLQVSALRVANDFDKQFLKQFDNGTGKGMVAALAFSSPPLTGSAVQIAEIDFLVRKAGTSDIGLNGVVLGKIGGEEIPSSSSGGLVNSSGAAVIDKVPIRVTNVAPALKSIIASPKVSYTLSEEARSGTVTFERTGGAADAGSPHVYNCTGTDLSAGVHTVATDVALANNTFYKVIFQFRDIAGNPPASVSSTMVFFDSGFGKGPVGNVDNTGASMNRVDDADVAKLKSAMGSRPGDRNWNPACDLNKDNRIDQKDLTILQSHYGE